MGEAIIEFSNGVVLVCEKNGSCFITDSRENVPADVNGVHITDDEGDRVLKYAELQECYSIDGRFWFGLHEVPENVRRERQLQANLEYLAMMSGVDLEV